MRSYSAKRPLFKHHSEDEQSSNTSEMLYKQVKVLAPQTIKVSEISSSNKTFSAWKGWTVLAKLSSFAGMWITKSKYQEFRVSSIYRKCF